MESTEQEGLTQVVETMMVLVTVLVGVGPVTVASVAVVWPSITMTGGGVKSEVAVTVSGSSLVRDGTVLEGEHVLMTMLVTVAVVATYVVLVENKAGSVTVTVMVGSSGARFRKTLRFPLLLLMNSSLSNSSVPVSSFSSLILGFLSLILWGMGTSVGRM